MPEAGTTFRRRAGCKSRSYNWRVHMACLRRREKRREGETRQASGGEADEAVSERQLRRCMYYVCMIITYSRVWNNRVRLPILLVVS